MSHLSLLNQYNFQHKFEFKMNCCMHNKKVRYICTKQSCQKDLVINCQQTNSLVCEQECLKKHLSHPQHLIHIDQHYLDDARLMFQSANDFFCEEITSYRNSVIRKLQKMMFLRRNITQIIDEYISILSIKLKQSQAFSFKIPQMIFQLQKSNFEQKNLKRNFESLKSSMKNLLLDKIESQLVILQEKQDLSTHSIKNLLIDLQRINFEQSQAQVQMFQQDTKFQISIEGTAKDIAKMLQKCNFSKEKAKILHLQINQDTQLNYNLVLGNCSDHLESKYVNNLAWIFMSHLIRFFFTNCKMSINLSKKQYFMFGIKIYSVEAFAKNTPNIKRIKIISCYSQKIIKISRQELLSFK